MTLRTPVQGLLHEKRARRWAARRRKLPEISPIFKADTVRLPVSRKKDGKSGLLYAQIGRFQNRPASRGACAPVPRRYV
jgi:hypothetical protein